MPCARPDRSTSFHATTVLTDDEPFKDSTTLTILLAVGPVLLVPAKKVRK
jgi:hypothetical protein